MATIKFEDALARLEIIATELENGDLPLDEILIQDKDGKKRLRAYNVGTEEADESLPSG
jgi:exodeoxyribonuclease VII small subunit